MTGEVTGPDKSGSKAGGAGRGDRVEREGWPRELSMELVPFHGSLETIILIKLTTDPPHGYKGILRNDLPRIPGSALWNRWISVGPIVVGGSDKFSK